MHGVGATLRASVGYCPLYVHLTLGYARLNHLDKQYQGVCNLVQVI